METKKELTDKALEQVNGGTVISSGRDEVKTKIFNLLNKQLGLKDISISSKIIDDLGADSLDVVDIIKSAEDEFRISIPESRASSLHTVGDLCDLVVETLKL